MRHQKLFGYLSILFLVPLSLWANTEKTTQDKSDSQACLVDEMLIKPSYLEFEEPQFDTSFSSTEAEKPANASIDSPFFSTLQANAGISTPISPLATTSDSANTWIPKFVWIGDIQDNDELKCFAAFLIGSLANKEGGQQITSPGVFMTPQILPNQTAHANPSSKNYISEPDQLQATLPNSSQLVSRRSSSIPPTEMPVRSRIYTELQAGLGFLYFAGVRGNLIPQPTQFFPQYVGEGSSNTPRTNYPIRGHIQYNRTLLLTADIGYRLFNFINFAVTFQAQQGVHLRTKPLQTTYDNTGGIVDPANILTLSHFEADLDLYSIGGKLLFNWHNLLKFNSWSMSLFFGGSAAAGWQSWTKVQAVQFLYTQTTDPRAAIGNPASGNISFRSKYFANFSYTGDAGLIFTPTNIFAKTSLRLGCKFIGWGSSRRLGSWRDQNDIVRTASSSTSIPAGSPIRFFYFKPLIIKTIYSWAPYIGFKWEF